MFKHRLSHQGFTLVELSIVLVIIGLLVGGILVGQSMIESARINAQIRQFQQFEVLIMNFKSKFKYLPGDSPMFTPAGNASGLVRGCWSGCGPSGESQGWNFNAEIAAFWKHVSDAGFVQENYTFTANDGRPGINVPIAAYEEKPDTGVYVANPNDDTSTYLNVCSHPTADSKMCADSATYNAFSAKTTIAIDKKIDDGRPRAGAVTVMTGPWNNMGGGPGCVTGNSNSDNATYDITSSNKNACNLRLRINKN